MSAPFVVTFYSFKGGVGRTTLLVNVAHALAARGERVVIWDLDLEAPGVHHFPGLEPPETPWQGGFLEWLGETPPDTAAEPPPDWPSASWLRSLTDRVYSAGGRRNLFVLPAHGTGADLGRAYARIDWHALFVQQPWHGLHLFKRVRDELIARFEPSFLFIDSRTGITDLGGVLTGFLPDCTVLVGNYGAQSTHGLRGVYVALDRFASDRNLLELRRERKLERLLVASPVPTAPVARDRGRARWSEGFPGVAPRSLVEVPLVESLLYAEDVLVRSAPSSDAAKAYSKVAEQLAALRDARAPAATQRFASDPGVAQRFEVQVAQLLGLLGFEVGPSEDGDMLARDRRPLGGREFSLACAPDVGDAHPLWRRRMASAKHRAALNGRKQLLVVQRAGPDVRTNAEANGIELRSVQELEEQLVDLQAYRTALCRDFEDSPLARGYVNQRFADHGDDAVTSTQTWLSTPGPRLMLVVGDGGSGKSSFLKRLAYELASRIDDDDDTLPTPLLINLLEVAGVASLESVIQEHLRRTINWHGNPEAILYLLQVGRVLLLLDGFDELSSTSTEIGAEEQLRVLSRPTLQGGTTVAANRIVISCRKHFVRNEEGAAPAGREATVVDGLAERLNAAVRELAPFELDQIKHFLRNRLGVERGDTALDALQQLGRGGELAPSPLYLDLMTREGALLGPGGATDEEALTVTRLFEHAARDWIVHGSTGSVLRPAQRERLIERLAAELWRLPEHELHHLILARQLHATERALLHGLDGPQIDRELRTAPFLVRSADGVYRFSQRAFLEYFLSCHLVNRAEVGVPALTAALATERLSETCAKLFAELITRVSPAVRNDIVRSLMDATAVRAPADVSDNATRLLAATDVIW